MLRKTYAPEVVGIFLLACVGFAVGFGISYGWIRQSPWSLQSTTSISPLGSDKDNDGLSGPVNRVRTEIANLSLRSGKLEEGTRELLESTTYDPQGKRIDNSYYLVSSNSRAGQEEYVYDEKGNISEMTVRDNNDKILSKEVYVYEYDAVGNWVKMVTSNVIYEGGNVAQQPAQVTYRNISYYFDQAIADIVKSNPSSADTPSGGQGAQGDFAVLRGAFDRWIAATNARDLEGLMQLYNSKVDAFYRASNVSQEFVRADKARSFQRAEAMKVSAVAPEITISPDSQTATMRFRKEYDVKVNGREHHGEVLQLLRWQQTGEGWKIVVERDVKVLRRD